MMDNNTINNCKLSIQASGVLTYLISKPDNWQVRISDVVSHFTNGLHSIKSAFKELIESGYLVRNPVRQNNGKFIRHDYIVYENPYISNPNINKLHKSKPKPLHGNQLVATHPLNNTNKKNKTNLKQQTPPKKYSTSSVVKNDPSLKPIKEETILLLYEFGIKNYKKLFSLFPIGDIFDYLDWMIPFKSKIRNKFGFLFTALNERWSDPENYRKLRIPCL